MLFRSDDEPDFKAVTFMILKIFTERLHCDSSRGSIYRRYLRDLLKDLQNKIKYFIMILERMSDLLHLILAGGENFEITYC